MPDERTSQSLTLTTCGITLLSVLFGIGVTVAFGIKGSWVEKVVAGVATTVLLTLLVKLGSSRGRGPLARLANWVIGPTERS